MILEIIIIRMMAIMMSNERNFRFRAIVMKPLWLLLSPHSVVMDDLGHGLIISIQP